MLFVLSICFLLFVGIIDAKRFSGTATEFVWPRDGNSCARYTSGVTGMCGALSDSWGELWDAMVPSGQKCDWRPNYFAGGSDPCSGCGNSPGPGCPYESLCTGNGGLGELCIRCVEGGNVCASNNWVKIRMADACPSTHPCNTCKGDANPCRGTRSHIDVCSDAFRQIIRNQPGDNVNGGGALIEIDTDLSICGGQGGNAGGGGDGGSSGGGEKGDWVFCSSNSECANGLCSNCKSDDGQFKCTPGGCGDGGSSSAPKKGDWVFCSSNSECANGLCSNCKSDDGQFKCTPGGCGGTKGDWVFCSSNSECANGLCSNCKSDDGQFKCTPGGCGNRLEDNTQNDSPHLSSGAMAGIIIGAVIGFLILSVLVVLGVYKIMNKDKNNDLERF